MQRVFLRLTAALALLLLVGCATLGNRLEPPRVNLAGLRLVEMSPFEMRLEVDLRVFNRNSDPLAIQGLDCAVELNGRHFAQGVGRPQKAIPAYGSDTVTVTVYAALMEMVDAARTLIAAAHGQPADEKWSYAVKGDLRMGSGLLGKIPFTAQGEIDLKDLTGSLR